MKIVLRSQLLRRPSGFLFWYRLELGTLADAGEMAAPVDAVDNQEMAVDMLVGETAPDQRLRRRH